MVVQLPGRLPDQFPKVWRSFVYRPRRRLKHVPRDCTCMTGTVRSATHSVSWASCWDMWVNRQTYRHAECSTSSLSQERYNKWRWVVSCWCECRLCSALAVNAACKCKVFYAAWFIVILHCVTDADTMDFSKLTLHQAKRLEMESQVHVLELESQLEKERRSLSDLRKTHYRLAAESEGWDQEVRYSDIYHLCHHILIHGFMHNYCIMLFHNTCY